MGRAGAGGQGIEGRKETIRLQQCRGEVWDWRGEEEEWEVRRGSRELGYSHSTQNLFFT